MSDDLTTLISTLSQAGGLVTFAAISYFHFRQERARVREIQELRMKEQGELYEARIEDQRRYIDTLTAILTARGVYQTQDVRPITNVGN